MTASLLPTRRFGTSSSGSPDPGEGDVRRTPGWWRPLASLFLVLAVTSVPTHAAAVSPLPDYARAFYRGDYGAARDLAAARLRGEPSDTQARIVLARVEAAMGHLDAAYDGFREALRRDPHSPDALYYLGVTAGALAQAEYERLIALAPDSARAHQLRAESFEARGRRTEAEAEYKAALEKAPGLLEALIALGDLARSDLGRSQDRLAEARGYYERALEKASSNYDALYGLGACSAYGGDHAHAIEWFRRALKEDPDSAPAHLVLGISLLQTGQTEAAVAELETATRLQPKMRQAYFHLARAYHTLGREQETKEATARFQELAREEQEANQALIDETSRPR